MECTGNSNSYRWTSHQYDTEAVGAFYERVNNGEIRISIFKSNILSAAFTILTILIQLLHTLFQTLDNIHSIQSNFILINGTVKSSAINDICFILK